MRIVSEPDAGSEEKGSMEACIAYPRIKSETGKRNNNDNNDKNNELVTVYNTTHVQDMTPRSYHYLLNVHHSILLGYNQTYII